LNLEITVTAEDIELLKAGDSVVKSILGGTLRLVPDMDEWMNDAADMPHKSWRRRKNRP
jgi:hypothetical protein